jgi:hypothetical protein
MCQGHKHLQQVTTKFNESLLGLFIYFPFTWFNNSKFLSAENQFFYLKYSILPAPGVAPQTPPRQIRPWLYYTKRTPLLAFCHLLHSAGPFFINTNPAHCTYLSFSLCAFLLSVFVLCVMLSSYVYLLYYVCIAVLL